MSQRMTPERLQRLEEIYHAACARLSPRERETFIAEACGTDEELCREVEKLLAEEECYGILDLPGFLTQSKTLPRNDRTLRPGSQLDSYVLEASIGRGGMGEVWKARDLRLGREVAIKISAQEFTDRFDREARAIAALNHSNICTLYDVGADYLVMELVEGQTLAERIERGPVPLEEALRIALQIAAAIEAAHDKGIVHRDLKPANIKVRADGSVKVLDFGLAKSLGQEIGADSFAAMSAGVVAGSPSYMPPEQIRGDPVDRRADIWAYGVVVYEMVTGQRPFAGRSVSETIAKVLTEEPDWKPVPPNLERLLRRCLEKDQARRMRSIASLELLLESPPVVRGGTFVFTARWITAVAALFAALTALLSFIHFREKPVTAQLLRFVVNAPAKTHLAMAPGELSPLVASPDGRQVVFSAQSESGATQFSAQPPAQLWVRSLDNVTARPLEGTDNAVSPFWSPDSLFIAFGSGGKLKKVGVNGGPVIALADAGNLAGGSWSKDHRIVFAADWAGPILQVPDAGGDAKQVTALTGNQSHRWPSFLPDGRHFLFASLVPLWGDIGESATVSVGSVDSPESKQLFRADSNAIFADGYLLFLRESTLMAQRFDVERLAVTGEPFPIASGVQHNVISATGLFSASETGVLAYSAGPPISRSLIWFDRSGKQLSTLGEPGLPDVLHLSPDRTRVAVAISERSQSDIWIYDVLRNVRTRFTAPPGIRMDAIWSPDGGTILFNAMHDEHLDLYRKPSNGTGGEELVYSSSQNKYPDSWSADGRSVFFTADGGKTGLDLWVLAVAPGQSGKASLWLQTNFNEANGRFSPDGRWVAYQSLESGRLEVYVSPVSRPQSKQQVSTDGGRYPRWRSDGKEIFYVARSKMLTAVEVSLHGDRVKIGKPQTLFGPITVGLGPLYDVSSDGQRILVSVPQPETPVQELTVMQNWTAGATR